MRLFSSENSRIKLTKRVHKLSKFKTFFRKLSRRTNLRSRHLTLRMQTIQLTNLKQQDSLLERYMNNPKVEDPEILKLVGIPEECKDLIRVLDANDQGLKLLHYIDDSDFRVHHVRGIIVATEEKPPKIVCKSFPFTPEIVFNDESKFMIKNLIETKEVGTVACQTAPEGTLIRVFNYRNKWYMSTHKKINGSQSRWDSPTFGFLFSEIIGDVSLDDVLDKKFCYVFLMCHPNHVLVCKNEKMCLYCVAAYLIDENMREVLRVGRSPSAAALGGGCDNSVSLCDWYPINDGDGYAIETHTMIKHPRIEVPRTNDFDIGYSFEDFERDVKTQDPNLFSGFLLRFKDGTACKITNEKYEYMRKLRGNEPNVFIRYIELRNMVKKGSKDIQQQLDDFVAMFPIKKPGFDRLNNQLNRVIDLMYFDFEYRYVNGNYLMLFQKEFFLLEKVFKANAHFRGVYLSLEDKTLLKKKIEKEFLELSPKDAYDIIVNKSQ